MTALITIFLISLAGVAVMMIWQWIRIKKGIVSAQNQDANPIQEISVHEVKHTVWQTARALSHVAIMTFIRWWALFTHWFQKKWQQWFGYKMPENSDGTEKAGKESFFLHSISEYKGRLKRIKEKLKEKDKDVNIE